MGAIRLDKYLAESGAGTRSEVKKLIGKGRIKVNGRVVDNAGMKLSDGDEVTLDGELLLHENYSYYMLNKPRGVVSATEDNLNRTVLDILKGEKARGLFPMGRLDKDTEGLLVISNDGNLSHLLLSPGKHVSKTYYIIADNKLTEDNMIQFEKGIDIGEDKPCKSAVIEAVDENASVVASDGEKITGYPYKLTITEGKYHQVKRMFHACGSEVIYLKRLSMGKLLLDEQLKCGEYRKLTENEIELLRSSLQQINMCD